MWTLVNKPLYKLFITNSQQLVVTVICLARAKLCALMKIPVSNELMPIHIICINTNGSALSFLPLKYPGYAPKRIPFLHVLSDSMVIPLYHTNFTCNQVDVVWWDLDWPCTQEPVANSYS